MDFEGSLSNVKPPSFEHRTLIQMTGLIMLSTRVTISIVLFALFASTSANPFQFSAEQHRSSWTNSARGQLSDVSFDPQSEIVQITPQRHTMTDELNIYLYSSNRLGAHANSSASTTSRQGGRLGLPVRSGKLSSLGAPSVRILEVRLIP